MRLFDFKKKFKKFAKKNSPERKEEEPIKTVEEMLKESEAYITRRENEHKKALKRFPLGSEFILLGRKFVVTALDVDSGKAIISSLNADLDLKGYEVGFGFLAECIKEKEEESA